MPDDEAAFLRACQAAPGDALVRLVYADWLDERGDPRGLYLRQESEACDVIVSGDAEAAGAWLDAKSPAGLSDEWVASAGVKCDVVLIAPAPDAMVATIKMVRLLTGAGLAEAKRLAESAPVTVLKRVSLRAAAESRAALVWSQWPPRAKVRARPFPYARASVRRAGTEPAGKSAPMTASSPGLPS